MKTWIVRISIPLNILILVAGLGAWFNRDVFIHAFLDELYKARVSFFESFPLHSENVVMLGDSITQGRRIPG